MTPSHRQSRSAINPAFRLLSARSLIHPSPVHQSFSSPFCTATQQPRFYPFIHRPFYSRNHLSRPSTLVSMYPVIDRSVSSNVLGHACVLQVVLSEPEPEHWLPPCCGAGLSQDRVLDLLPLAQVWLQEPQAPQFPQAPSTERQPCGQLSRLLSVKSG